MEVNIAQPLAQRKANIKNRLGLLMAFCGQALKTSKSGDCATSAQPIPLLHSAQSEHFFLVTNLNFAIGQRKKMRMKRKRRINTKCQDNTKWKAQCSYSDSAHRLCKQLERKRYRGCVQ